MICFHWCHDIFCNKRIYSNINLDRVCRYFFSCLLVLSTYYVLLQKNLVSGLAIGLHHNVHSFPWPHHNLEILFTFGIEHDCNLVILILFICNISSDAYLSPLSIAVLLFDNVSNESVCLSCPGCGYLFWIYLSKSNKSCHANNNICHQSQS